jgi:hypothetical protein
MMAFPVKKLFFLCPAGCMLAGKYLEMVKSEKLLPVGTSFQFEFEL